MALADEHPAAPSNGMDDPRVHEFRAARGGVEQGLSGPSGARERYRNAIGPYLTFMSEFCPEDSPARKHLMAALFYDTQLPLGAIAIAFKATEDEVAWIGAQAAAYQPEPVDEQDRLNLLGRAQYRLYLKTPHWQSVRKQALERAGHRCQLCNDHQGPLEVHHRFYRGRAARFGAERPADVIVLCASCHARHHGKLRPV